MHLPFDLAIPLTEIYTEDTLPYMQNSAPKLFIAISFVMAKYLTTQMRICRRLAAVCASHTIVHAALRRNGGDLCSGRE